MTVAADCCDWGSAVRPGLSVAADIRNSNMPSFSRRQFVHALSGAAALRPCRCSGQAQDYPSRPIRLVIPYGAGGSGRPDRTSLGRQDVIAARGRPSSTISAVRAARSGRPRSRARSPTAIRLLLGNGSTQVIIPLTSANPGYSVGDFRAIYRLINSALVFAVHPSVPVADLRELIAHAKANPGKLSYGTPGVATEIIWSANSSSSRPARLTSSTCPIAASRRRPMISSAARYRSSLPSCRCSCSSSAEAGKIRLLAVTTATRLSGAPDIPTAVESGMPDLRYEGWFGLFAPRRTDNAIIDRIAKATRLAMSRYRAPGELSRARHGA